jgi:hypothetical protein
MLLDEGIFPDSEGLVYLIFSNSVVVQTLIARLQLKPLIFSGITVPSVSRIRDVYPGSDSFPSRIPDRIRIEEFKCFNPKKWFLNSRSCPSRIPDPGVKKATDRRSWIRIRYTGTGTLHLSWVLASCNMM